MICMLEIPFDLRDVVPGRSTDLLLNQIEGYELRGLLYQLT